MRRQSRKNGFTLIEIMLVLSIVAALLILGASGVKIALDNSADQSHKEVLVELSQALQTFYSEYHYYPDGSCFNGSGVDKTVDPTGLQNSMLNTALKGNTNDPAYIQFLNTFNKINTNDYQIYGYCAAPNTGTNDASSYILIVETKTAQSCKDTYGNNMYMLGSGTYPFGGNQSIYYDIGRDYGAGILPSSINCYKSTV